MTEISMLIVEDNTGDAYLIEEYLNDSVLANYTITHCLTLADAMKEIEQQSFDVIFLDLGLPDSVGFSSISDMIITAENTPVIVITGNDDIKVGIQSVKAGAQDFLIKGELRTTAIDRSVHHAIERKRLLVELNELREHDHRLATHDSLTGLVNRASLKNQLDNIISHAKRSGEKLATFFIDLDRFKNINDTQGHDVGDLVLIQVAKRLTETLRESDVIARIGGDEFICILRDAGSKDDIANIAQKINDRIEEPFVINDQEFFIGCSIGISLFPDNGRTCDDLLSIADTAMYFAKESGRNQYTFADDEIKIDSQQPDLEVELRHAFEKEQFSIYYQPVIDLNTKQIHCCEALVRWEHPVRGTLLPGTFFPYIKQAGLLIKLGEYVLEHVARDWKENYQKDFPSLRISVNISSTHFRQKNFVECLTKQFDQEGIPYNWLDIEITENVILQQEPAILEHFDSLKEKGISISIDNFGKGYSSFSYLRDFPLSTVKIDKSLINDISSSRDDRTLVMAILGLSQQLGMDVIIEGVETLELATTLQAMNCNNLQGYYYSKPLPSKEYLRFMHNTQQKTEMPLLMAN